MLNLDPPPHLPRWHASTDPKELIDLLKQAADAVQVCDKVEYERIGRELERIEKDWERRPADEAHAIDAEIKKLDASFTGEGRGAYEAKRKRLTDARDALGGEIRRRRDIFEAAETYYKRLKEALEDCDQHRYGSYVFTQKGEVTNMKIAFEAAQAAARTCDLKTLDELIEEARKRASEAGAKAAKYRAMAETEAADGHPLEAGELQRDAARHQNDADNWADFADRLELAKMACKEKLARPKTGANQNKVVPRFPGKQKQIHQQPPPNVGGGAIPQKQQWSGWVFDALGERDRELVRRIREEFHEFDQRDAPDVQKQKWRENLLEHLINKRRQALKNAAKGSAEAKRIFETIELLKALRHIVNAADPEQAFFEALLWLPKPISDDLYGRYKKWAAESEKDVLPPPEESQAPSEPDQGFEFVLGGHAGWANASSQDFLGREAEPGNLELGAVKFDRDMDIYGFDAGMKYEGEITDRPIVAEGFFRYSEGNTSDNLGTFDPDNAVLLIPGTGDPDAPFSAGIAVPSAGGLNIVEDMHASYDYEYLQGGVNVSLPYTIGSRSVLAPIFGVSYLDIDQTTKFSGSVPGFGFDFAYDTPVSMNTWQMLGGLRYECKFSPWVGFFAEPSAQINFIDVSGSDRFTLDGTVATAQKVSLDKDETLAGLIVKVGLDIEPPDQPFEVYVGGRFEYQPNTVTVSRSGERDEQSRANIDYSETYTIEASINWRF